jgi:hypothetical protein
VVGDAILEEDVVGCKGKSPGSSRRSEEWHGDTETNFGSHVCIRNGEVVDHRIEQIEEMTL